MAGKKFAAEFALRRNVSAQDKILIQDSDDDVVKYAYPPQIASLSGYAYAQSVADLPLLPTNKSIGYIVGQMLYIYVGMGGDTKDGLYQSVGFFVGPQGVQGEKGEKGERGEQGVQGPKGDNGGLSLQELDEYLVTKQYVTGDTLADMLAGYVSNTSLMRDYVTIAKMQDVTGVKNFTAGVQFGGLSMYKSKGDTVYLDANLVVRGGVTAFGTNETITASIFEALPIDGATLKRTENGVLYVDTTVVGGGGTVGGGISIADVENYLTTNGYLTDITGKMVTNALGYTPLSTSGGTITATGRRQLSLQSSTDAQATLWLGTGLEQFSKGGILQYDYSNGSVALVNFSATANSYSGLAGLFIKRDNRITVGDANLSVEHDILHTGNIGQYALPITGGTVNGAVTIDHSGNTPLVINQNYGTVSNPRGVVVMNSTLSNSNLYISHLFGKEGSMRNSAWVGFYLDSAASNNNRLSMGLYGVDNVLNILGSGNVAIGGTTATEKLEVHGGAIVRESLTMGIDNYTTAQYLFRMYRKVGTTRNRLLMAVLDSNDIEFSYYDHVSVYKRLIFGTHDFQFLGGNVAIGGTTASEKLHVYGNILATGGITAQNSSDERLKRNLRKFNASKVLMSLGGVWEYEYIDSEVQKNHIYEGTHYGLIYQHVKDTTLDVMCHEREDGFGTLNYIHPKFISLIAGATMENISEVEKLKRKIRHLEAKVKQLEQRA